MAGLGSGWGDDIRTAYGWLVEPAVETVAERWQQWADTAEPAERRSAAAAMTATLIASTPSQNASDEHERSAALTLIEAGCPPRLARLTVAAMNNTATRAEAERALSRIASDLASAEGGGHESRR